MLKTTSSQTSESDCKADSLRLHSDAGSDVRSKFTFLQTASALVWLITLLVLLLVSVVHLPQISPLIIIFIYLALLSWCVVSKLAFGVKILYLVFSNALALLAIGNSLAPIGNLNLVVCSLGAITFCACMVIYGGLHTLIGHSDFTPRWSLRGVMLTVSGVSVLLAYSLYLRDPITEDIRQLNGQWMYREESFLVAAASIQASCASVVLYFDASLSRSLIASAAISAVCAACMLVGFICLDSNGDIGQAIHKISSMERWVNIYGLELLFQAGSWGMFAITMTSLRVLRGNCLKTSN
ncbi:hypothetical protein [Bremerella cremea]|uniref:hypothetical protein n=1 Tax=Bremerella cremea TaxID=1031537 RepID=UPI0031EEDCBB